MFFIYTLLYAIALVFFLPRELMKRPPGRRMAWLSQKLGRVEKEAHLGPAVSGRGGGAVWVHAVSVGEVLAAAPFIEALEARGVATVISTITETGRRVARGRFPGGRIIYLPFDLPFAFKRAAKGVGARAFVLVETELWPNAIRTMQGQGVPVFIVNGRLSEKSTAGYRRLRFFFRRVLKAVSLICVQDGVYAERAALIGGDEKKILVTGNFKFEMNPKGLPPAWTGRLAGPVIVAGSTHPGEEEFLVGTYKRLRMKFPSLIMVLAPRHPERVPEVESLIRTAGVAYVKSSLAGGQGMLAGIVVVDTVGELFDIYAKADVAIMGGSFSRRGGQNPLEPAYWGKPVLCGPDMSNFSFMGEFLKSGGAVTAEKETLFEIAAGLLADEGRRAEMGAKARRFYLERPGAVKKTIDAMMDVLGGNISR
ncbi:MAG: hypothetical protein M0Z58_02940 [Nitrospiraceae bacterium]|nr:hypothetical protein [Nitrospiraceae bacterium]